MTAKHPVRWSVAALVSLGAVYGLARASSTPVSVRGAESSRLRLSWSARPERIEVCRTLSAEELSRLEEHMRQRVKCDGRFATYALRVTDGDRVLHESVVHGAGLRHDRPLFLLRELEVQPGVHRIRVTFERRETPSRDSSSSLAGPAAPQAAGAAVASGPAAVGTDTGLFAGRAQREAIERVRRARAAIPARLAWDGTITFSPGSVALITLDPRHAALQLVNAQ